MENILSYTVYFVLVVLLNILDYYRFKSVLNPFFFLSIPFTLILILCITLNNYLDFTTIYPPFLNIWSIGLAFFWLGGVLSTVVFRCLTYRYNIDVSFTQYGIQSLRNIKYIKLLFLICGIISLLLVFKSGLDNSFGSKEMGEEIGQGGIAGRISNILLIAIPFYFIYKIHWIKKITICILLLVVITAIGSKTWMTYSILSGFILLNMGNKKIKIKGVIITFLALFLAFTIYYKLNTEIEDSGHFTDFILRHIYFYFTSGILPLSEVIKQDIITHGSGLHHPIINLILYKIDPSSLTFHSNLWITTDNTLGTQSNVFTFFGTLLLGGGSGDFILYSTLSGLISYIYLYCYRCSGSIFFAIPYAYTLSILFFGWYNWGFGFLRIWEIYIYSFIFFLISKKRSHAYSSV